MPLLTSLRKRLSSPLQQALRKQFDLREEIGPSDYIVRMLALTHTTAVSDIAGLVMEKASMVRGDPRYLSRTLLKVALYSHS